MDAVLKSGLGELDAWKGELNKRIDLLAQGYEYHSVFSDFRLKRNDTVRGITGTGVVLLAGSASVSYPSGSVIDVSAGETVSSGSGIAAGHRYMVAEDTEAVFTITSDTAVISTDGYYCLGKSAATDYNALAGALKEMNLFRGSDTPYGFGYALEEKPTRIQGLVMFLRLIGEEEAALAFSGKNPFKDTDPWCDRYLAYAYAMGYTKGVDLTRGIFDPQTPISATQYMTFLLRRSDTATATGNLHGMPRWTRRTPSDILPPVNVPC
jgi:predicted RecA/RadA family phage recombinase